MCSENTSSIIKFPVQKSAKIIWYIFWGNIAVVFAEGGLPPVREKLEQAAYTLSLEVVGPPVFQ